MDISTTPQTKRTNGKKTPTKRGKESRMESASFNSEYLREDFKLQFSTAFKNKDHYKNGKCFDIYNIEIISNDMSKYVKTK